MITLRSGRLRVDIAYPGKRPNDGFRFDRTAFVNEVVLDGDLHFCAGEPRHLPHPSSGGRGLCCEFKGDVSGEAAVGEYFPKFGVGLLRKEDEGPYVFHRRNMDVRLFPITVEEDGDGVLFHTRPLECLGYAAECRRMLLLVEDNSLVMNTCLHNVGEKPLRLQEYCHNFLSIDSMALGPSYTLDIPAIRPPGDDPAINRRGQAGALVGRGRGYTFSHHSPEPFLVQVDLEGALRGLPFGWTLRNSAAKAWVSETDSFFPQEMALWIADHIVSPEVFLRIELAAGEKLCWTRRWTFGGEGDPLP